MAELRATAEALAAEIAKGEQATLAYNQLRLRLNPVLPALPDHRSWTYKLIAD